ncbi:MAG: ATP phosphoribosyltransferase regulatory subunit [Alphaproteobacteria bacterium]|jgi:ATP phosphoribosyltransferase regulatory subunit|nr:ATP phosphoribosyltransferase regulatory subunit [Alphaproteobacteria bacterium]MDP6516719.1 ATP phosphoribosyltransferase regulatory subunit [Alphaproteobacteria bacterium]
MNDRAKQALLPAGLGDLLPPEAEHEEAVARLLMDRFTSYGYDRVKPPLVEFEDGLLDGIGASVAGETFRLMDPVSQRMMGVRADITPQVARLAATRLTGAPRPLRISYSGEVLRLKGSQLRPARQFRATGVELIGAAKAAMGDAEVILLAAEAVGVAGISGLTVDITAPALARAVCAGLAVPAAVQSPLLAALDRKDAAAIDEIGGDAAAILGRLLAAAGPAEIGVPALAELDLAEPAGALAQRLVEVVELVGQAAPTLSLTIDPVERRGFEYHTGVSFTLFALGVRAELGSGGRYLTANGEPATGFTLFMDTLMQSVPGPSGRRRVFVPFATPAGPGQALRADGWVTINGLIPDDDPRFEAARLGCSHVWLEGAVQALDEDEVHDG